MPIAALPSLLEKLVLLRPYALQWTLKSVQNHLNDNNEPILVKKPTRLHANERRQLHDVPVLVEYVRFALLVDMKDVQNTVFDWYGQHGSEQHET
ncbi:hypothetical protein D3C72_2181440 [compost metagenome]